MTTLEHLQAMARDWGGEIVHAPRAFGETPDIFESSRGDRIWYCPFDKGFAIEFDDRRILTRDAAPNLGSLIHEMGHTFACASVPSKSREFEFFGWEYVVARKAGCLEEWLASNAEYRLETPPSDFGAMSPTAQSRVLAERVVFAGRNGLIKGGAPVCVRRRKAP
jgi:hypothetical protein